MKSLGVDMIMRNAVIGGVPSIRQGWCQPKFLEEDADVVSWDYSMNKAGTLPEGWRRISGGW